MATHITDRSWHIGKTSYKHLQTGSGKIWMTFHDMLVFSPCSVSFHPPGPLSASPQVTAVLAAHLPDLLRGTKRVPRRPVAHSSQKSWPGRFLYRFLGWFHGDLPVISMRKTSLKWPPSPKKNDCVERFFQKKRWDIGMKKQNRSSINKNGGFNS